MRSAIAEQYVVVDGSKRVRVLGRLRQDVVTGTYWDLSEADALIVDRLLVGSSFKIRRASSRSLSMLRFCASERGRNYLVTPAVERAYQKRIAGMDVCAARQGSAHDPGGCCRPRYAGAAPRKMGRSWPGDTARA